MKTIMIILMMLLPACGSKLVTGFYRPEPAMMEAPDVQNGSPEYQQGWKDGCHSGFAAYGNDYYKTFYRFKHDKDLITDETYSKVWLDAFTYCRHYVNRTLGAGRGFGEGFFKTNENALFGEGDLRTEASIHGGFELFPVANHGIDPLGWGDKAWGANVDQDFWGGGDFWGHKELQ